MSNCCRSHSGICRAISTIVVCIFKRHLLIIKVSKGVKIRNRSNQVPHLTQDTNGKVTKLELDTTNESQDVSPFPAGDHKAHINKHAQRHYKHKTEKNMDDPQKKYHLGMVSKIYLVMSSDC